MIDIVYHTAYIALGSNLGDRVQTITRALALLRRHPDVRVVKVSRLSETEPVGGPPDQPKFFNGVAQLHTTLLPDELLQLMQDTESQLGRTRRERWGPRTIDLDLLLYGNRVINEPHLQVPHPLMHQRRFVMAPLAQIAPEAVHPILKQTARQILEELQKNDKL
jgi:2-amino-4-hydroxy-6-hydroxymethyldihydropteridine diphosphokinase